MAGIYVREKMILISCLFQRTQGHMYSGIFFHHDWYTDHCMYQCIWDEYQRIRLNMIRDTFLSIFYFIWCIIDVVLRGSISSFLVYALLPPMDNLCLLLIRLMINPLYYAYYLVSMISCLLDQCNVVPLLLLYATRSNTTDVVTNMTTCFVAMSKDVFHPSYKDNIIIIAIKVVLNIITFGYYSE